ncbi:hypothetical protein Adt_24974 [Abeliophyllum distichum]|uniref:Uncharacterized protein n=1 Tax=Abeliophyllum distichum TaxID=126358 RepID=A0ABD1SGV7_9LAMI
MLNYYLLVYIRHGLEPSIDIFRLLFEMKLLDHYDCFVVFSHRNRGLPAHDHFKIPNCPTFNSGWKNRYFFVKPFDGVFPFPLDWGILPFEDFNSTPVFTEPEIDSLITLRTIAPLGRSMNDVLTDDALVSDGIGRPYGRMSSLLALMTVVYAIRITDHVHLLTDMSADKFTEDFLEELARKNSRGQIKRRRDHSSADPPSSDIILQTDHQELIPVDTSLVVQTATVWTGTSDNSRSCNSRLPVENRQACNIRCPIEKVVEDCQAIVSCLDWEVIETSKDKSPESLERSIVAEERRSKWTFYSSLITRFRTLEETVDRLKRELAVKGEITVEEYKGSEEYMTTVGMVGVRSREMAFRKSREWLTEQYRNTDFFGAPFMFSIDEDDDDEDD